MQATISKHRHAGSEWFWKIEVGFYTTLCFPITTPKSALIEYARNNGAEHIKFMIPV